MNEVPLKEYIEKLLDEREKQVALALAALSKNRSDVLSMIALGVALLTAVAEFLHR